MDVVKSNFKELLPSIKKTIQESEFLSVDCELTGLNSGVKITNFDTQREYYDKIREGASNFLIIQFGLCCFTYDTEKNVFKQNCYNFYIFPRQFDRNCVDRKFLCQASSIDFLVGNNFDFNKLFKQGITYMNKDEETKCLEMLLEKQKVRATTKTPTKTENSLSMSDEDQAFVDIVLDAINKFIEQDEEELRLPKCNGYVRKLIYQIVPIKYGNEIGLETRIVENNDRILFALKSSVEKKVEAEKKRCEQELSELEDAVGFSTVIQCISDSGKLLVGHNFLLDILHIIDKFMTPIPTEYKEFKDCVHCLFPRIIDTKFMASQFPFKEHINSTVLGHLFETIVNEPFSIPQIEIDIENGGCGYNLNDNKQHEAGYDAFITGVSFLAMLQYLGKLGKDKNVVLTDSNLLNPFLNKIHLMRIQDCSYINLEGDDYVPPRDNILYMTFPKDWKTSEILQLFSPYGSIYIGWIDDCSAYVALDTVTQAEKALKSLKKGYNHTILSYKQYKALQDIKEIKKSPVQIIKTPNIVCNKSSSGTSPYVWKSQNNTPQEQKKEHRKRKLPEFLKPKPPLPLKKDEIIKDKVKKRKPDSEGSSKVFMEDNSWE